ncbi:MAG: S-layer homology domain-containing protein, partial [Oscillospiraceae bacterium]|nr:S-layer homology domain-containing protein [Oscillospiraceae bacterium]
GETIEYKITVTNDGNLTITNVKVVDELTGLSETIDSLAPGESKEFTTSYVVTEADILNGSVKNEATANGENESDDPTDPGDDDVDDPTEDPDGHITIEKVTTSKPANGESYALGEKITYKITVTNDGNLTVKDVTVTDELTGDSWTIASLAPDESKEFTAEYEVTEADVLAGEVVNVATAKGTSPDPDEPEVPVDPGEDPEPTEDKNGHLTIEKVTTSKPENGEKYVVGEKITYKITVTNDGNLTITDITVEDELTGDCWTIASLAPDESKEFTAEYVVTEADAKVGEVVNVATAKGTSPDPDEPDVPVTPGEDPEPVEEPDDKVERTITYKDSANGKVFADVVYKAYDGDPTPAFGPEAPARLGYTFMGWSPKVAKTVNGDATYWAMWRPNTPINPPAPPVEPSPALNYDDHVAYIIGYPDGNFYPNKYITRAETATMIFRLLTEARQKEIYTTVNEFSDVDASKWYNEYVSSMANGGYVEGYPDGTFGGDKMITRAEFVTILVRFFGLTNADCIFSDVSTSHWAYKYIATATAYGWLLGYEDGTFRPDQAITRAEAVTVINRMLNRGVDETSNIGEVKNFPDTMDPKKWYYYEIIEAANYHEYTGHRPNEQWYSVGGKMEQAG